MTYNEFNSKFNKVNDHGVITHTSLIDSTGKILCQGLVHEVEDFHDENVEIVWEGKGFAHKAQCFGKTLPYNHGMTNVDEKDFNKFFKPLFK